MDLFEEIRSRNKTTIDAGRELGRGLMRGDREELKLGYSWENAATVAISAYDLPTLDAHEVKIYLFGFANGMQDVEVTDETIAKFGTVSEHMGEALRAGWHAGQDEPSTVYPAAIKSAQTVEGERQSERVRFRTCGCGAKDASECAAAVEGYFTTIAQRSEDELRELSEGDECEAARIMLIKRGDKENR